MSVTGRLSRVLRRRRVQVAVAIVALGGAVTAVAVANIALLDVAGGAQDQVGGLSSRLDFAPASAPGAATTATTTAATTTTTTATTPAATAPAPAATLPPTTTAMPAPAPSPPVSRARDDDHGGIDTDRADEATEAGDN